jgi:phage tail-like protein
MPVSTDSEDALIGSRFGIELDGVPMAYFQSVSGFASESEVVENKVVGKDGQTVIRKIPGQLTWAPLTLSRGLTSDMELWKWRQSVIDGDTDGMRRNGSIVMYNHNQEEVARYNFEEAWPSKWTGPAASADDTAVAVEELEIQYEFLERVH